MQKPVTLSDVAKAAGVALGTASRVLNNFTDVDPDTRQRVLAELTARSTARRRRRRALVGAATAVLLLELVDQLFRELEAFATFGSELDAVSKAQLERGYRLVELLKQPLNSPMPVEEQVVSIFAGTRGYLDDVAVSDVRRFEAELLDYMRSRNAGLSGEQHGMALLGWDDVRTIRERYAQGDVSMGALGAEYGVHPSTIYMVVHHKTWKEEAAQAA